MDDFQQVCNEAFENYLRIGQEIHRIALRGDAVSQELQASFAAARTALQESGRTVMQNTHPKHGEGL